ARTALARRAGVAVGAGAGAAGAALCGEPTPPAVRIRVIPVIHVIRVTFSDSCQDGAIVTRMTRIVPHLPIPRQTLARVKQPLTPTAPARGTGCGRCRERGSRRPWSASAAAGWR